MGEESMATSSLYVHEGKITKGSELCQEVPAIEYPQHQWQGDVPSPVLPSQSFSVLIWLYEEDRIYTHFSDKEAETAQGGG